MPIAKLKSSFTINRDRELKKERKESFSDKIHRKLSESCDEELIYSNTLTLDDENVKDILGKFLSTLDE